jgi:CHASE1-domain containing sensor protein/two-component sensor histidine kinase
MGVRREELLPSPSGDSDDGNDQRRRSPKAASGPAGGATRLRSYVPTAIVLLLLLGATAVATVAMLADAEEKARQQFDDRVTGFSTLLEDAMRSYQQVLRAAAAAVNAMPTVTRGQWQKLVRDLSPGDFYPGIGGIGYVKRLRMTEIEAFVAEQRRVNREDFRFHPEGEREVYTSIVYLEPDDWRNRRAIGYDMFSEPRRRAAMEHARDSGRPAISRKITLLQETGEDVQPGTLAFMPIYFSGMTPNTIEARRAALDGYVYGAFRMKDFLVRVVASNRPDTFENLHVAVYDGIGTDEKDLLFDDRMLITDSAVQLPPFKHEPRFTDHRAIKIAGSDWTIIAGSTPTLEATIDRRLAWMVLFAGTLIAFLIAGNFASLAYAGNRYSLSQQKLSAEVIERKRAQDQAQFANRELIHRVKNMLAIVTAIASQTARYSPTVSDFNKSFRERLTALARVHDMLRPDPAHAPDLRSFCQEVLAPYCAHRADALSVDGPIVALTRNEAVLLSLLINEFGTNATKYGAWSVPAGQVSLSWRDIKDGEVPEVEIIWQERGGPLVKEPSKSGFGTNVMKFSIERGLRGRIATSFDTAGIRHEVRFPRDDGIEGSDDGDPLAAEE